MDINLERYYKSITAITGEETKSFLQKWAHFNFRNMYKVFGEKYKNHNVILWFVNIPKNIHCFLCCGFRHVKDDSVKCGKTWNNNYHMMSKLCRYKTCKDVKITLWDKIRFKLITGYKFDKTA